MGKAIFTRLTIIPMSQEEFLGQHKRLVISYSIVNVPIGKILIASTAKGICFLMPGATPWSPVETLKRHFPKAQIRCKNVHFHREAVQLFKQKPHDVKQLPLHLYGTPFQLSVWENLLTIPVGKVTSYLEIAKHIKRPKAARPVGQAVGSNPIMYLIPCHRVICSNGKLGGYRWGISKKIKILNRETRITPKTKGCHNWEPTFF